MKVTYNKVYIEITNICNMNCSFCHGHTREPKEMTRKEFETVLEKLTSHTKYIYYHLMGEPLLHPKLHEFIKLAGERGYKSIITTNGTLLRSRGREILAAGLHKVNISVHSFENGSESAHAEYLRSLAEFAREALSVGTIVVFRLWNNGYDNGKNDNVINVLKEYFPDKWVENTRGIKIRDKIFIEHGERFEWPDKDAEIKGYRFYCYGLKDQFGILADGTVVPCCLDSDGVVALGNIFTDDIDSVLNSERAQNIADGFKCGKASEELCKRCGYAQRFVK